MLLILFFLSGFTGLLYEVVWIRLFGLAFGNTTLSVSTVLAAYMTGLAFGSLKLGKMADGHSNPLKIYGLLELGIALAGLIVYAAQGGISAFSGFLFHSLKDYPVIFRLLQFLIAFIIMFPATYMMGGTLPILSRAVIRHRKVVGRDFGRLYSVNTFGAMTGVLITGFILIRNIGVLNTVILGLILNICIGLAAWWISGKNQVPIEKNNELKRSEQQTSLEYIILVVMGLSGFTALSYEVLWNRVLVFLFTNSVYAFTIMLTTFLTGIALGAQIGSRIADRSQRPLLHFGVLELGIGIGAVLATVLLIFLSDIHHHLFAIGPRTDWWQWNGLRFFEAFLVLLLPTICMGAVFPLAGRLLVYRIDQLGTKLGRLYFFNTLGGVLGSFLTGFFMIQWLGTAKTLAALVVINIFIGIVIIHNRKKRTFSMKLMAPLFASGLVLVVINVPHSLFSRAYSHVERQVPIIDFREGIEGTVTVHQSTRFGEEIKRIDVDGLNVAGTSFMLQTLQILQGHVPAMLCPDARHVVQIGFGTGQTTRSALLHSRDSYHLVEISRDVLDMSFLHFQHINHNILTHPSLSYVILDGKNYIRFNRDAVDIIMNDANYAVATGSASLFTKDHFEACRRSLRPGGFLSTWMTIDLAPEDFNIVLKTFQSVFPYCTLWMAPNCINKQVVLIGSDQPWKINFNRIQEILKEEPVRHDLVSIHIHSVYDLLDCLILDSTGIASISREAIVNTDNHPVLEFSTRAIRSRDLCAYRNIGKILIRRPDIMKLLVNLPESRKAHDEVLTQLNNHFHATSLFLQGILASYEGDHARSMELLIDGSRIITESQLTRHFFEEMDRVNKELIQHRSHALVDDPVHLTLARHRITMKQYRSALNDLRSFVAVSGEKAMGWYEIARCHLGLGHLDSARTYFIQSQKALPGFAGTWYYLGDIERRCNNSNAAMEMYQQAVSLDPRMVEAYNGIGRIFQHEKKIPQAMEMYQKSLSLMEFQPMITADLAGCYLESGNINRAVSIYRKAVSMAPFQAGLLFQTGNALLLAGNYQQSVRFYKQALQRDSLNSEIYYNLGNAWVQQHRFDPACKAFRQAIALNPHEPDYYNNLAMGYIEMGKEEDALQIFKEGLKHNPSSIGLKENYLRFSNR